MKESKQSGESDSMPTCPRGAETMPKKNLLKKIRSLWLKPLSVQGSGSGIPRKVVSTRKTSGLKRVVGRPPVPSFSCASNPF